ncbi:uncharacterized protein LOC107842309 isoform X3 [Capsicum annuum]|uniref:uncharacterized protein LOC107842309 isoform X3 n=1 Tax=Capsicum annuum TaxID=4072 RepID=UPI001FB0FFB0|nr:uncharacterized protein LOC107842309 isoform X3 [Capsicum annuum]
MSLDELVGNLKTYEMDIEDLNRAFESDEEDDEEHDETYLMAIGDSDMEEDDGKSEVRVKGGEQNLFMDKAYSRYITGSK